MKQILLPEQCYKCKEKFICKKDQIISGCKCINPNPRLVYYIDDNRIIKKILVQITIPKPNSRLCVYKVFEINFVKEYMSCASSDKDGLYLIKEGINFEINLHDHDLLMNKLLKIEKLKTFI